ncbi:serine protease [Microvirga tunisiensis]|uniref:serine protease n=1 Tax=Microvirga tunisiensis TaxID=2108360 RepID=UPI00138764E0|nr:serine protease [Microvirga tunisiensis]
MIATAIAATLLAFPVAAQTKNSPIYRAAASEWSSLDAYQRVRLQVYLTAAGYWPAVPNQDFSMRLFEAMSQFQSDHGMPRTGILNEQQLDMLIQAAEPILRTWGMGEITHPTRRVSIWAPLGLGLVQKRVKDGVEYTDPQKRVFLGFKYLENVGLKEVHDYLLQQAIADGSVVQYEVLRKDFFVVSVYKDGLTRYMRYHRDGNGLLGFVFGWNDAGAQIYGERIVTLISASLWAVANGAPFVTPPKIVQEAANPPVQQPQVPVTTPKPETKNDEGGLTSGSGFFVTNAGHIITNHHVIEKCSTVAVGSDQIEPTIARIIGSDPTNDLALLQANVIPGAIADLRSNARLGESVAVFGYPLSNVLSSSGNFTQGSVTALAGLRDDTRHLQIQAPVQSGNSGGPLLDASGNVIGVVVSMLSAKRMIEVANTLPQNINFAIKANVAANFLDSKGVQYATASSNSNPLKPEDIAERAKKLGVMVVCK